MFAQHTRPHDNVLKNGPIFWSLIVKNSFPLELLLNLRYSHHGGGGGGGDGGGTGAGVVVEAEAGGASPDGGGALDFASLFPEDFAPPENRNKMVVHTFYINKIEWSIDI